MNRNKSDDASERPLDLIVMRYPWAGLLPGMTCWYRRPFWRYPAIVTIKGTTDKPVVVFGDSVTQRSNLPHDALIEQAHNGQN